MRNTFKRVAATAALALAVPVGVTVAATPAVAAHRCWYTVTENAYVRENPSINSVIRKTKVAGETVTGLCGYYVTDSDGRSWKQVECTCATDGEGWIIGNKLSYGGIIY